jgi:adenylate cyclase
VSAEIATNGATPLTSDGSLVTRPPVAAGATGRAESIGTALVVDDSVVNRKLLAQLLGGLGLRVVEADHGAAALEVLAGSAGAEIDVVLLDVVMPEIDGYETLARIKADPELRRLPVIMISGVDELDSVVRCIELGAADYLPKPFDPAILRARITASLSEKRLRDLEKAYLERQTATNEILRIISTSAFDVDEMLATVARTAKRLCASDSVIIYLAEDGRFVPATTIGGEDDVIAYERAHPITPGPATCVGRVAMLRAPVVIPDVPSDPDYVSPAQQMAGFRSLLGAPILRDGEVVGVIAAARQEPRPFGQAELLLVTSFAEQAGIGIANTRLLQTIERQKEELSRFLSPQIAALVSSPDGQQLLAGHRRQITVVFADLRGFTAFAQQAEPEELLGVLAEYHRMMGERIVEHGGTLEHFAGDGMMIFFNDPVPQPDHVERAVRMAVAMRDRFAALARGWRKRGFDLNLGIGVATGYATLGRIGFEGRYDYGAIGNAVILASRLSSDARADQILLNQQAHAAVEEIADVEPVGDLELKGFSRPVPAVNVTALRQPTSDRPTADVAAG